MNADLRLALDDLRRAYLRAARAGAKRMTLWTLKVAGDLLRQEVDARRSTPTRTETEGTYGRNAEPQSTTP